MFLSVYVFVEILYSNTIINNVTKVRRKIPLLDTFETYVLEHIQILIVSISIPIISILLSLTHPRYYSQKKHFYNT